MMLCCVYVLPCVCVCACACVQVCLPGQWCFCACVPVCVRTCECVCCVVVPFGFSYLLLLNLPRSETCSMTRGASRARS